MTDDHRKRAKGISNDDGMVASRWRLDSYVGMRGAVDPLVTPVDMEKAGCCGSLAYGPMAKMDAGSGGDGMPRVMQARWGWDLVGTADRARWGTGTGAASSHGRAFGCPGASCAPMIQRLRN
jgi:hypothetical protein